MPESPWVRVHETLGAEATAARPLVAVCVPTFRPEPSAKALAPPTPAQKARVSDDRHQQKQHAQPELHPMRGPRWIDHLDQVVRDESVAIAGLSGTLAQVVLQ
jgi:hypothetical protein